MSRPFQPKRLARVGLFAVLRRVGERLAGRVCCKCNCPGQRARIRLVSKLNMGASGAEANVPRGLAALSVVPWIA